MFAVFDATDPRFNPRTREGCDGEIYRTSGSVFYVSIHAPARGATKIDYIV